MIRYWKKIDKKTKWFYFQWFIYMLALILSTVYAYARLDFVRTGPAQQMEQKQ